MTSREFFILQELERMKIKQGSQFGDLVVVNTDVRMGVLWQTNYLKCYCKKCGTVEEYNLRMINSSIECKNCKGMGEIPKKKKYKSKVKPQEQNTQKKKTQAIPKPELTDKEWLEKKLQYCSERAVKKGVGYNITPQFIEDLYKKQKGRCALTGDEFPSFQKISIDRIDSNGGYTTDNIQLVTINANLCKRTLTMKEFVALCKKVAEKFK